MIPCLCTVFHQMKSIEGKKVHIRISCGDANHFFLDYSTFTYQLIFLTFADTIISWRDPDISTELALSFQEAAGCSYIWLTLISTLLLVGVLCCGYWCTLLPFFLLGTTYALCSEICISIVLVVSTTCFVTISWGVGFGTQTVSVGRQCFGKIITSNSFLWNNSFFFNEII